MTDKFGLIKVHNPNGTFLKNVVLGIMLVIFSVLGAGTAFSIGNVSGAISPPTPIYTNVHANSGTFGYYESTKNVTTYYSSGTYGAYLRYTKTSTTTNKYITLYKPYRVGYKFLGYWTEASGGTYVGGHGTQYNVGTYRNLYAKWETYNANRRFQNVDGSIYGATLNEVLSATENNQYANNIIYVNCDVSFSSEVDLYWTTWAWFVTTHHGGKIDLRSNVTSGATIVRSSNYKGIFIKSDHNDDPATDSTFGGGPNPLIIDGGRAMGVNSQNVTGSLLDLRRSATLGSNLWLMNNSTTAYGAGAELSENDQSYTVNAKICGNNSSGGNGGGLRIYGTYVNMSGAFLDMNRAVNGGGVYMQQGNEWAGYQGFRLTVNGATVISNNTATETGGGISYRVDRAMGSWDDQGRPPTFLQLNGALEITTNTAKYGGGIYSKGDYNSFADRPAYITINHANAKIINNYASVNGGGVYAEGTFFNMSAGQVLNNNVNSSSGKGGGLYFYPARRDAINIYGETEISGGTISGNSAYKGGGIYSSGSTWDTYLPNVRQELYISGGTISNNTATYGGGVYNGDAVARMFFSGGTISGNTATNEGGGIYNDENLEITAGTISKNTATYGAGIYNNSGNANGDTLFGDEPGPSDFKMTGGYITENIATQDGGGIFSNMADFSNLTGVNNFISGGTISKNQAVNGYGGGIYLNQGFIDIQGNTNLLENSGSGRAVYFHYSSNLWGVFLKKSTIQGTVTITDNGKSLPGYDLIKINTATVEISGGTLTDYYSNNGYTIATYDNYLSITGSPSISGKGIWVNSGKYFTATGYNGSGVITIASNNVTTHDSSTERVATGTLSRFVSGMAGYKLVNSGNNIYFQALTNPSTLTIDPGVRGSWVYNSVTYTTSNKFTKEQESGTTFTVSPNPTSTGYTVLFNAGSGTSTSTSLTNTRTFSSWTKTGGGSFNSTTKVFTFNGTDATLTANYTNGSITLPSASRAGYTFNGWYRDRTLRLFAGAAGASYTPTSNHTLYAKYTTDPSQYIAKSTRNSVDKFYLTVQELIDAMASDFDFPNNQLVVVTFLKSTITMAAGEFFTVRANKNVVMTSSVDTIITHAAQSGSYFGGIITVRSGAYLKLVGTSSATLIIDGSGYTRGPIVSVSRGTFRLEDYVTLTGGSTPNSGGGVFNYGTFTMTGGTITGNTATSGGGGVYNEHGGTFTMSGTAEISGNTATYGGGVNNSDSSTFTMMGGTISGNTATTNGGGVFNMDGTFEMSGGTISGNTATYGGGVCNAIGTFEMSGGTISGNTATSGGGGVYNEHGGTFTMSGTAEISGNTATYGGGVNNSDSSTFTMTGGTITGNTSTNRGGGVENSDGTFTMTGGTISGNTATYGGGVCNAIGTFEMSGGTISGNTATYGGGIYNDEDLKITGGTISGNTAGNGGGVYNIETFEMSGGEISGNTAETLLNFGGGGVYNSGTLTMSDGEISGNTAFSGGGVYNYSGGTFEMSDGEISGNTAKINRYGHGGEGGGIFNDEGGTLTVSGSAEISGNTATNDGGGVYNGGTFEMSEGTISENTASDGGGVNNYGTFEMSGGTISGNTAGSGGGIFNYEGRTLTVSGSAEITGNTADWSGGGVFNGLDATFIIDYDSSLEISGNTATDGGGIYNDTHSYFEIYGNLEVSGNQASSGGGIRNYYDTYFGVSGNGSLEVSGNTASIGGGVYNSGGFGLSDNVIITGNTAHTDENEYSGYGGGFYNNGILTMSGGEISDNTATYGGGVYNESGIFEMSGGEISGNTATYGGGVCNDDTFEMNGGTISGNTASVGGGVFNDGTFTMTGGSIADNEEILASAVYQTYGGTLQLGAVAYIQGTIFLAYDYDEMGGGKINVISRLTDETQVFNVTAENPSNYLLDTNAVVEISLSKPIEVSPAKAKFVYEDPNENWFFTSSTTYLRNLYLYDKYKLTVDPNTANWTYGGETSIEVREFTQLPGTQMTIDNPVPAVEYRITFDGNGSGAEVKTAGGVVITYIDTAEPFAGWGDMREGAYFTGWIYGNPETEASSGIFTFGGGNVTMLARFGSATITLPTAVRTGYIFSGWYNSAVGGNFIGDAGDVVIVSGSDTIYAQWDLDTGVLTADAQGGTNGTTTGWTGTGATSTKTVTYTYGVDLLPTPTRAGYVFDGWYKESGLENEITSSTPYTVTNFNMDANLNATIYAKWITAVARIGNGANAVYYQTLQSAVNAVPTTGVETIIYIIVPSLTQTAQVTVQGGRNAVIMPDSNVNVTITRNTIQATFNMFTISGTSTTLTLQGDTVNEKTLTLDGQGVEEDISGTGRLIYVSGSTTTFNLKGGVTLQNNKILPSNSLNLGGAVYIISSGTFNMTGGTITGNTAHNGGGVYIIGTFTMTAGTISNNKAAGNHGGGVYITGTNSTISMSGGTISGNTATINGGGVYNASTFTMNGTAEISGNNATNGSGVFNYSGGTFTMSGTAEISGNTATSQGGGVYNSGTLIMSGTAEISGNTANSHGGGVYNAGTFNMTGGKISGSNTATTNGGGVYNAGTFTMSGTAEISGNNATSYGGGVYNAGSSTFIMTGGEIISNSSTNHGGGVYNAGTAYLLGGKIGEVSLGNTITGNNAAGAGVANSSAGKLYLSLTATVNDIEYTGTGVTISHNSASSTTYGGGGVRNQGIFEMSAGTISNNTQALGAGVYNYNATFTMSGGTISGNKATSGGGVNNDGSATFTMSGTAKIIDNEATSGGGIYTTSTLTITGGTITGNTATGEGSGVYLNASGTFNLGGNVNIGTNQEVYLASNAKFINQTSALTYTGIKITIVPNEYAEGRIVTKFDGTFTSDQSKYQLKDSNYSLYLDGSDLKITTNYTLTYRKNDGTETTSTESRIGHSTSSLKTIATIGWTRTGYTFTGWNTVANGSGGTPYADGASFTMPGSSTTLYAQWSANTYTISYDSNGGSSVNSTTITFNTNFSASNLPTPTKTGYTFNGWYTHETADNGSGTLLTTSTSFTTAVTFQTINHTAKTLKIYANWTAIDYTITIAANGGTGGSSSPATYNISASSQTTTITHPTRTGYTVTSYTVTGHTGTKPSVSGTTLTIPANTYGNLTLTANWTANKYNVNFNDNHDSINNNLYSPLSIMNLGTWSGNEVTYSWNGLTVTYNIVTGIYKLHGTSTVTTGSGFPFGMITGYSIPQGSKIGVILQYVGGSYTGSSMSLPVDPTVNGAVQYGELREGLNGTFVASGQSSSVKTLSNFASYDGINVQFWQNSSTTVTFTNYQFKLNVEVLSGAQTQATAWSADARKVTYNSVYSAYAFTTPTRAGYTFDGWYTEANGGTKVVATDTYLTAGNTTLYAHWTPITYQVKYNANKPDTASGSITETMPNSVHTYDVSQALSANAFTLTGWAFNGWNTVANGSGGTSYADGVSVKNLTTVNGDVINLYAQWTAQKPTLTFTYNGATGGNLEASRQVTYDQNVGTSPLAALPTPTKTGYTFDGWYKQAGFTNQIFNDTKYTSANFATDSTTLNSTIYANWTANDYLLTFDENYNNIGTNLFVPTYIIENGTLSGTTYTYTYYYDFENSPYSFTAKYNTANGQITFNGDVRGSVAEQKVFNIGTFTPISDLQNQKIFLVLQRRSGNITENTPNSRTNTGMSMEGLVNGVAQSGANRRRVIIPLPSWTSYSSSSVVLDGSAFNGLQFRLQTYSGTDVNLTFTNYAFTIKAEVVTGYESAYSTDAKVVRQGTAYSAVAFRTPVRAGYTFTGWNTQSNGNGTTVIFSHTFTNAADQTLYAQWTANSTTLTVNPNGGTWSGSSSSQQFTQIADTTKSIPVPLRPGYTFDGWAVNGLGGLDPFGTKATTFSNNIFTTLTPLLSRYQGSPTLSRMEFLNTPTGSGYVMNILANKMAGNNLYGGFSNSIQTYKGQNYYFMFVAKIPVGYQIINTGANGISSSAFTWLTTDLGTGEWQLYCYKTEFNTTGTNYGDFGYTYLQGLAESGYPASMEWQVAYYSSYNATGYSSYTTNAQLLSAMTSSANFIFGGGNTTLTAMWTQNVNTISFSPNYVGGGINILQQNQNLSSTIYSYDHGTNVYSVPNGTYTNAQAGRNFSILTDYNFVQGDTYTLSVEVLSGTVSAASTVFMVFETIDSAFTRISVPNPELMIWNSSTGSLTGISSATITINANDASQGIGFRIRIYTAGNVTYTNYNFRLKLEKSSSASGYSPATYRQLTGLLTPPDDSSIVRAGYTFAGWYKEPACTNAWNFATDMAVADTTLYAKWTPITYEIKYNANKPDEASGSIPQTMPNSIHTYDVSQALSANAFTLTGWAFNGWNTQAGGGGTSYADGVSVINLTTVNGDVINLYAQWTAKKPTLTFNYNGATGGNLEASRQVTYDQNVGTSPLAALPTPTKTGYTFDGWYKQAGFTNQIFNDTKYTSANFNTDPTTLNSTIYAKWTANTYTISYDSNGGSAVSSTTIVYNTNFSALNLPAATKTGYTFNGWYTNETADNGSGTLLSTGTLFTTAITFQTIDHTAKTLTVYAKWTANVYTITLSQTDATTAGTSGIYEKYATGYYKESGCTTQITTSTNAITAPQRKYTVTYNYNGGSGSPASADATYTFNGYYTASSGGTQYIGSTGFLTASASNTYFTANGTLYAQWTSGAVTLPTPTKTGYTFGGWYSDSGFTTSVGAGGASYTPTEGVTLYAKWTAITYTVTYNSNKPTSATGSITGTTADSTHTYDVPKALTTNGYTLTGWAFDGWNTLANGSGTSYADGVSVTNLTSTNGATVTLYAQWTKDYATLYNNSTAGLRTMQSESDHIYYKNDIKNITFTKNINDLPAGSPIDVKEMGANDDGSIRKVDGDDNISISVYIYNSLTGGYDIYIYTTVSEIRAPENCFEMFQNFWVLETINWGIFNFRSNVTSTVKMFQGCNSLDSINFTSFDTSGVTDMSYMFQNYGRSTTTLNLTPFDTSSVTNMSNMFEGCLVPTLNLTFDTSNVTNMSNMFDGCLSTTILFGENFTAPNVTNMSYMFRNCINLTELDLSNCYTTDKLVSLNGMFYSANTPINRPMKLETIDLSGFVTTGVTTMYEMFYNCEYLKTIEIGPGFNASSALNLSYMFYDCLSLVNLDLSNFDTSGASNMSYMFNNCSSLTSIDLSAFDTSNVTNMSFMFRGCSNLTSLDLSGFNTSSVNNMGSMFRETGLINLDVSYLNTANVTIMSYMFSGSENLTTLNLTTFNTAKVSNMSNMFSNCTDLTSVNLSSFNTSVTTSMTTMFSGCSSLTSLVVSNFDTANVTTMNSMFKDCSSLTSLDVSNFNTAKITNMGSMFSGCSSLTTLNLSNFDTAKVTSMTSMFYNCTNLISVNVSSFNTSAVKNMNSMFKNCSSLTTLNISNFSSVVVTNISNMLYGCSGLWEIYTPVISSSTLTLDLPLNGAWYNSANIYDTNNPYTVITDLTGTVSLHLILAYTLTAYANGGTFTETTDWIIDGTGTTATKIVLYNQPIGTLITINYTGYTFGGWFMEETFENQVTASTNFWTKESANIYAKWTANTYTISYDSNGGSGVANTTIVYNTNFSALNLPAATKTGYTFNGWYTNETADNGSGTLLSTGTLFTTAITFQTIDHTAKTLTVYAKWTLDTGVLTADAQGGTNGTTSGWTGTGATSTKTLTYTEQVGLLPTPTRARYVFGGWYKESGLENEITSSTPYTVTNFNMDANLDSTIYAKWIPAVARIGSVYYATLQDAVNAVPTTGVETIIYIIVPSLTQTAQVTVQGGRNAVIMPDNDVNVTIKRDSIYSTFHMLSVSGTSTTLTLQGNTPNAKILTLDGQGVEEDISGTGRLIYVSGSTTTFNLKGGVTLQNNKMLPSTSSNLGGAVYIINSGTFNMTGGTITGNTAYNGGGVYVNGKFSMTSGTISNNKAGGYHGGGVYITGENSTISMSGTALITGNTAASYGAGVYIGSTGGVVFTMTGGSISGNTATSQGGGVYNAGTFTMSGSAEISGNTSTNNGGGIFNSETGITTVSGGTISENTATWGGGIYNSGTFTISGTAEISENTATTTGGGIYNNGTLNISSGTISSNTSGNGGGIINHATLNLSGTAEISENTATSYGGGVYNAGTGTFNFSGGDINNNESKGTIAILNGGGVYNDGTMNMSGGNIYSNEISSTYSGSKYFHGIGIYSTGTLILSGGNIYSNVITDTVTSTYYGGGIEIRGTASKFIMTGGNIYSNTAYYGGGILLNTSSTGYLLGGTIGGESGYGNTGVYGGGVRIHDSTATLYLQNSVTIGSTTYTGTGVTISNNTATYGGGILNTGTLNISSGNISGNTAIYGGGVLNSEASFTMTGGTISENTANNGGGIYNDNSLLVMTNGTIKGNTAQYSLDGDGSAVNGSGGGIYSTGASSSVYLLGGTIGGSSSDKNTARIGGGVNNVSSSKLYMQTSYSTYSGTGVTISYNTTSLDKFPAGHTNAGRYYSDGGGGIYNSGTFTMSVGTLAYNIGVHGGAIRNYGTTTISGGTISYNEGVVSGSVTRNGGTFTISGGTITNNSATGDGGALFPVGDGGIYTTATLTITGGTITNNTATGEGSGVYLHANGTFNLGGNVNIGTNQEVYLASNAKFINQTSALTYAGLKITIVPNEYAEGRIVTKFDGTFTSDQSKYQLKDSNYSLYLDGSDLKITGIYTLNYHKNDGSGLIVSDNKTGQSIFNLRTIESLGWTRTGYTFNGWNTASDGTGTYSYADGVYFTMPSASVDLYVVWKVITFTITSEVVHFDEPVGAIEIFLTGTEGIYNPSNVKGPVVTTFNYGDTPTYTINVGNAFRIKTLTVNTVTVEATAQNTYIFPALTSNCTISVTLERKPMTVTVTIENALQNVANSVHLQSATEKGVEALLKYFETTHPSTLSVKYGEVVDIYLTLHTGFMFKSLKLNGTTITNSYMITTPSVTTNLEYTVQMEELLLWLNYADSTGIIGEGTQESPYEISTPEQLSYISNQVRLGNTYQGTYFILKNNISLDRHYFTGGGYVEPYWYPIGTETSKFQGNFIGDSFTVSDIDIYNGIAVGLFGYVGQHGDIFNIKAGGTIYGSKYVGGIVGHNEGTIRYSGNLATVNGTSQMYETSNAVGGVVGYNVSSNGIYASYNAGRIDGYAYSMGGVVGYNLVTTRNAYNVGTISNGLDSAYTGGIVGYSDGDILYVYNASSVTRGTSEGSVGTLFGYKSPSTTISNAYYDNGFNSSQPSYTSYARSSVAMKPLTTAAFNSATSIFAGWNNANDDIWEIRADENNGYPVFAIVKNFKGTIIINVNYDESCDDGILTFVRIIDILNKTVWTYSLIDGETIVMTSLKSSSYIISFINITNHTTYVDNGEEAGTGQYTKSITFLLDENVEGGTITINVVIIKTSNSGFYGTDHN